MCSREPVLVRRWREEMVGYSCASFRLDILAGLTVAAASPTDSLSNDAPGTPIDHEPEEALDELPLDVVLIR